MLKYLTSYKADDACDLIWSIVERILEYEPRLVRARSARAGHGKANIFGRYQDFGL